MVTGNEIWFIYLLIFLMGVVVGLGICGFLILGEIYFVQKAKEKEENEQGS